MLKKTIAATLALSILLLPCHPAAAASSAFSRMHRQMPADTSAFGNLAGVSIAKSASVLLDRMLANDAAFSLILDMAQDRKLIAMPAASFKQMLLEGLLEAASVELPEIAPGCLAPYTIAAITLLIYTPTELVLFFNALSTQSEKECSLMYGSWTIMGICAALASWTQYRICAEQNSDTPDQNTLARLQSDLLTMQMAAVAFAASGSLFSVDCSDAFYLLDDAFKR